MRRLLLAALLCVVASLMTMGCEEEKQNTNSPFIQGNSPFSQDSQSDNGEVSEPQTNSDTYHNDRAYQSQPVYPDKSQNLEPGARKVGEFVFQPNGGFYNSNMDQKIGDTTWHNNGTSTTKVGDLSITSDGNVFQSGK